MDLFEGEREMEFYQLYKRRGFSETLCAIYSSKNHSCTLSEFLEKLEQEANSYYNAFFRVKEDLLDLGLIKYGSNRYKERVLRLTTKGIRIARLLKEIDELFDSDLKHLSH